MSKKIKYIIFFIGIIAFIGGMILISNFLEDTAVTSKKSKTSKKDINEVQDSLDNMDIFADKPGEIQTNPNKNNVQEKLDNILEVTEKTFEKEVLKSNKKVLVDFYADWCGPCQMMHPILEEIAEENPDIKVVQVNVDYNYDLSMEYGAMSIPMFIAFEDGKEIDSIVGAVDKEYLLEMFE